jgi:hypothetical protein
MRRSTVTPQILLALAAACEGQQPVPAPSPPSGLHSAPSGNGGYALMWSADATVDVYEVEVGGTKQSTIDTPLLSVTTATANVTVGVGTMKGIAAATGGPWFKVRGHAAAGAGIENDVEWSDFSLPAEVAAHPSAPSAPQHQPAGSGPERAHNRDGSRFTLMYRVSEVWGGRLWGRTYPPPDFLASHNSASGPGQASFLTFAEMSLLSTSASVNASTITEYCVESNAAYEVGKYLSCPAGGNMSSWGPQQPDCYCAHDIDRYVVRRTPVPGQLSFCIIYVYLCHTLLITMIGLLTSTMRRYIQHRDFCGGDTWRNNSDDCGGTCQEMWGDAIDFTNSAGIDCVSCTNQSCESMSAVGKPLCTGCTRKQCNALWSYVWSSKPQRARQQQRARTQGRYGTCTCAAGEVDYSLKHMGAANISWPPGLGAWFSTPQGGECAEGALIGTNSCSWRRHPSARMAYGYQLVDAGFRRSDGPDVHGQTLVGLDRHVANAAAFQRTFTAHPVKLQGPCRPEPPFVAPATRH